MKIIFLSGILIQFFVQGLADQKVITCESFKNGNYEACRFSDATIGQNETIYIRTNPEDLDVNTIAMVQFTDSSIHSVPSKIFTKFPNLKWFSAPGQNIQEISPDTFKNAKNLDRIDLTNSQLKVLHPDTLRGNFLYLNLAPNFLIPGINSKFKGLANLMNFNLGLNQLRSLHRDTFKDNVKLIGIYLYDNQITSLHPEMFSHLNDLKSLDLRGNVCVNKDFWNVSKATIEKELWGCGYWYLLDEQENL
jgi:Leucine-rich repeat (LRR) protein